MTKAEQAERDEAREYLRETLRTGETLYTILRNVSRSGMSRTVDVYAMRESGPLYLSGWTARAAGYKRDNHGALKVGGCGFDAGFDVVYNIGRAVFPDGFECIGEDCRSNDHSNGDRDHSPHHHTDGGYAFPHRWM